MVLLIVLSCDIYIFKHQGCRICGSVAALLPGTFYFARHFLFLR